MFPPKGNVSTPQTISKQAIFLILIIIKILNSHEFCFNNKNGSNNNLIKQVRFA